MTPKRGKVARSLTFHDVNFNEPVLRMYKREKKHMLQTMARLQYKIYIGEFLKIDSGVPPVGDEKTRQTKRSVTEVEKVNSVKGRGRK